MTDLTHNQFQALKFLARLHDDYPNTWSFRAGHMGASMAANLRQIAGTGYVRIHKFSDRHFRYEITLKGRSKLGMQRHD